MKMIFLFAKATQSCQYSYEDVVTIGYAFDFTLSNVAKYSNGSHEVMIKYAIPSKKKNRASMN